MTTSFDGPLVIGVAAWIVYLISMSGSRLAARSKGLPDRPNHRSSHTYVTSKAGGLAIMGGWFAGMFVIGAFAGAPETASASARLSGLAGLALGLGLADDRWRMSPVWKFMGQAAIGGLFVVAFSALRSAPVPFMGETVLGWAGPFLTVFWIVAFMNAFNFMDGVNGLAAGCAAVGLSGFCIAASFGGLSFAAAAAFLLAAAAFGFIPVNLKRGTLFMGDNGSQAISFLIAALGVVAANASGGRISAMLIPVIFLPFIFDVTLTLAHRIVRRKNILAAHREHIYQLLLRSGASHLRVTVIYMALTAFSTAAAILMLALPAAYQWAAPAFLIAFFSLGAARVYKKARDIGLLADDALEPSAQTQPDNRVRQAAE